MQIILGAVEKAQFCVFTKNIALVVGSLYWCAFNIHWLDIGLKWELVGNAIQMVAPWRSPALIMKPIALQIDRSLPIVVRVNEIDPWKFKGKKSDLGAIFMFLEQVPL